MVQLPGLPAERFTALTWQVVQIIEHVIENAAALQPPPQLVIGTGNVNDAAPLMHLLEPYPGQATLIAASDNWFPNSPRLMLHSLPSGSPLRREWFALVMGDSWHFLFAGARPPHEESRFVCAMTEREESVRAAADLLDPQDDLALPDATLQARATARLLWRIADVFDDLNSTAAAIGELGLPLQIAGMLSHQHELENRWQVMQQAFSQGSAENAALLGELFRLELSDSAERNGLPMSGLPTMYITEVSAERQFVDRDEMVSDDVIDEWSMLEALERQLAAETQALQLAEQPPDGIDALGVALESWDDAVEVQPPAEDRSLAALRQEIQLERALRIEAEGARAAEQAAWHDLEGSIIAQNGERARLQAQLAAAEQARAELEQAIDAEIGRKAAVEAQIEGLIPRAAPLMTPLADPTFADELGQFLTRAQQQLADARALADLTADGAAAIGQIADDLQTAIQILHEVAAVSRAREAAAEECDLVLLLQQVYAQIAPYAAQWQVNVLLEPQNRIVRVPGDFESLLRALSNVAASALYLSRPQTVMRLMMEIGKGKASVHMHFQSTPAQLESIEAQMHYFETGIPRRGALPLARAILSSHGGSVSLRPGKDDGTAEFVVHLPMSSAQILLRAAP